MTCGCDEDVERFEVPVQYAEAVDILQRLAHFMQPRCDSLGVQILLLAPSRTGVREKGKSSIH